MCFSSINTEEFDEETESLFIEVRLVRLSSLRDEEEIRDGEEDRRTNEPECNRCFVPPQDWWLLVMLLWKIDEALLVLLEQVTEVTEEAEDNKPKSSSMLTGKLSKDICL